MKWIQPHTLPVCRHWLSKYCAMFTNPKKWFLDNFGQNLLFEQTNFALNLVINLNSRNFLRHIKLDVRFAQVINKSMSTSSWKFEPFIVSILVVYKETVIESKSYCWVKTSKWRSVWAPNFPSLRATLSCWSQPFTVDPELASLRTRGR